MLMIRLIVPLRYVDDPLTLSFIINWIFRLIDNPHVRLVSNACRSFGSFAWESIKPGLNFFNFMKNEEGGSVKGEGEGVECLF